MVNNVLKIGAEFENVKSIEPMGGVTDPSFTYYFKLRCENCGEETARETAISLEETIPIPKSRGVAHLIQKCKGCGRDGTITMVPTVGRPLTIKDCQDGILAPLMGFDCRGLSPFDFSFICPQWKVVCSSGTVFEEVDLSSGDWAEYDEKKKRPVTITNLKSTFETGK